MRPADTFTPHETFEQMRSRILADTARYIEWGLANPDKVRRIPRHRVGEAGAGFTERFRVLFWTMANRDEGPGENGQ
jgi:hypothetical protein